MLNYIQSKFITKKPTGWGNGESQYSLPRASSHQMHGRRSIIMGVMHRPTTLNDRNPSDTTPSHISSKVRLVLTNHWKKMMGRARQDHGVGVTWAEFL